MNKENKLKDIVKSKYGQLAEGEAAGSGSCCSDDDTRNKVYNIMMDDYSEEKGYVADADLGLGCGLPTAFAKIQRGDTVIDLGAGAGNDCFVARHETGPEGKVIGIDFTPAMIKQARKNAEKNKLHNVEFREGDIEEMPVNSDIADVVVSNCVLNLVPNKARVISEIFRVLRPGGHFSISDIVLRGELPASLREDAEMYAGCVSGAIQQEEYLALIQQQGFENIILQKEKPIQLPDHVLEAHLSASEKEAFQTENAGIYSITVYAEKPTDAPSTKEVEKVIQEPGASGCCG